MSDTSFSSSIFVCVYVSSSLNNLMIVFFSYCILNLYCTVPSTLSPIWSEELSFSPLWFEGLTFTDGIFISSATSSYLTVKFHDHLDTDSLDICRHKENLFCYLFYLFYLLPLWQSILNKDEES